MTPEEAREQLRAEQKEYWDAVEEMTAKVEASGDTMLLWDLIEDMKRAEASDLKNSSLKTQVKYILDEEGINTGRAIINDELGEGNLRDC